MTHIRPHTTRLQRASTTPATSTIHHHCPLLAPTARQRGSIHSSSTTTTPLPPPSLKTRDGGGLIHPSSTTTTTLPPPSLKTRDGGGFHYIITTRGSRHDSSRARYVFYYTILFYLLVLTKIAQETSTLTSLGLQVSFFFSYCMFLLTSFLKAVY
jgi:hypothetical protein